MVLVETIGSHDCTGYRSGLPDVVKAIADETGILVEHRDYPAYGLDEQTDVPMHIRAKLEGIRSGGESASGAFIAGQWLRLSPHNNSDAILLRKALLDAALQTESAMPTAWTGMQLTDVKVSFSTSTNIRLAYSQVGELGSFSTHYGRVWFFEGAIDSLSVGCAVERFTYKGFDINKLVEVASQHPELFNPEQADHAPSGPSDKVDLNDITIHLVGLDELDRGWHPCFIVDHHIDPTSNIHRLTAEAFGGWGYAAKHGDRVRGFVGIMPKDLAHRDAQNFLPPGDLATQSQTLLLTCFIGGQNSGAQYGRIGIVKKIVQQVIVDARKRGYACIEGNPHDVGIGPLLLQCGFTRVEWPGSDPHREKAYYQLFL